MTTRRSAETELVLTPSGSALRKLSGSELLWICSPWIKSQALDATLSSANKVRVLTRGSVRDFALRVSDLEAFERLLQDGHEVRIAKNLHAKIYLASDAGKPLRGLITSANLTTAGLESNLEAGLGITNEDLLVPLFRNLKRWWDAATPIDDVWVTTVRAALDQIDIDRLNEQLHDAGRRVNEGAEIPPEEESEDEDIIDYDERYLSFPLPEHWIPVLDDLRPSQVDPVPTPYPVDLPAFRK